MFLFLSLFPPFSHWFFQKCNPLSSQTPTKRTIDNPFFVLGRIAHGQPQFTVKILTTPITLGRLEALYPLIPTPVYTGPFWVVSPFL